MKISVVMAAFNSQATIARAIESFLGQTYADKELLVVDGASRDETCRIVADFNSPLIRLHSEPDRGIYDALNKGINRATGAIVGVLHTNDFYVSDTVLQKAADLMRDGQTQAVYADVKFFPPGNPDRIVRHYRSESFSPEMLRFGIMPAHPTLFLRKDIFDRFGLYRTDMRIAGDFEFVARIFKNGSLRSAYVPETWIKMQTGGASNSGVRSKITLNAEIIRACRINGIPSSWPHVMWKYTRKIREFVGLRGR